MNQQQIIEIAMLQSSYEQNCSKEDFLKKENVVTTLTYNEKFRKYYKKPISANFVSYGSNIVVSTNDACRNAVKAYVEKFDFYHCFETPNLHWLNERLKPIGQSVCFMAEYWLPDFSRLKPLACAYELRVLTQSDFADLYLPQWSNALCEKRKELDVLGIGAFDGEKMVGLAACSADCDSMWQIGVDVLPEYRKQEIASAVTSNLALRIIEHGKVPFYCCAWSNVASARNAVKSGFSPAWAEMTVKPSEITNEWIK